jgi:hypothetical protein
VCTHLNKTERVQEGPGKHRISEQNEEQEHTIQVFTDGSKSENGVGSGAAICVQNELTHQMEYKFHDRCSNHQAGQLAIVKTLQAIKLN